jgi:hypothetical protein
MPYLEISSGATAASQEWRSSWFSVLGFSGWETDQQPNSRSAAARVRAKAAAL